ncbi:MAG: enoyl-CoA hydratase/isomerase family protein [Methylobacteriaceae bacterium]|nr:enoyl-CoA hydratase/isomerase family protein [Methylobacteriaceae bacterium]
MSGETDNDIQVRRHGRLGAIVICRPSKRNALAERHFHRLAALLTELDADPGVGAVLLTGEGDKAFCAGADLSPDEQFLERLAIGGPTGLGDVLRAAHALSKPVIGRVNGACYAGGVGLLAACDLVVACDDARFALPEVKLGLFPFVVVAALRRRVAPLHLTRLALTGQPIDAADALRIGLVSHIAPRAGLDLLATSLAEELADLPAAVLRAGLRMSRGGDAGDAVLALAAAESQGQKLASGRRAVDRRRDDERSEGAANPPSA